MYFLITYGVKGKKLSHAVIEGTKDYARGISIERAVTVHDDVFGDEDEIVPLSIYDEEFDEVVDQEITRKTDRMTAECEEYNTAKHGKLKLTNSNHPTAKQLAATAQK